MGHAHRRFCIAASILAEAIALPTSLHATHAWGSYHWARTDQPFTLKVGDNLGGAWDPVLDTSIFDWSQSVVLDLVKVAGSANPKTCKAVTGRVEVCNAKYGNSGWLGVAGVYASGSHITRGYVKLNDTYFNTATYNTSAWRNLVACQEIGHTLGLDHQDEGFSNPNLGTCMDYTNSPESNQLPNAHDYEMLEGIYAHLDTTTTLSQEPSTMRQSAFDHPGQWGQLLRSSRDGRHDLYVADFGGGHKVFHFVYWVDRRP